MQKQTLSHSMFNMWRCMVAIAHADGHFGKEELDYFSKVFDNLIRYFDLTQAQRDTFADDLYHAQDIDVLFAHINDPEARATLVFFAEELMWIDGVIDSREDAILTRLHLKSPESFDRQRLLEDIRDDIARNRAEWDAERAGMRETARARNPFFHAVDAVLMKMGIDILD